MRMSKFQSLIHQGFLCMREKNEEEIKFEGSFNPLFIRGFFV